MNLNGNGPIVFPTDDDVIVRIMPVGLEICCECSNSIATLPILCQRTGVLYTVKGSWLDFLDVHVQVVNDLTKQEHDFVPLSGASTRPRKLSGLDNRFLWHLPWTNKK